MLTSQWETGQWFVDQAGHRWFFDSGALSLDLGYTGPFDTGVEAWERLHAADDLAGWLTARFGTEFEVTKIDHDQALRLRSAIVRAARAAVAARAIPAADVDLINTVAAGPDLAPQLPGGIDAPPSAAPGRALATIARDAVAVFSAGPERIRTCGADDCGLIFFDGSRPNSRRWCSMRRCGNRAKVRNHRRVVRTELPQEATEF